MSPTVEFVLGNRLICRAQTARQISRATRASLLKQSTSVPTTAGPATVCDAEIPTRGCNFTRSATQTSLVWLLPVSSSFPRVSARSLPSPTRSLFPLPTPSALAFRPSARPIPSALRMACEDRPRHAAHQQQHSQNLEYRWGELPVDADAAVVSGRLGE